MRRRSKRSLIAAGASFVLAIGIALTLFGGGPTTAEAPANVAALQGIAEKNDDAATRAAARMRDESRRATVAADALAEQNAAR